jgi:hypothetical protein
VYALQRAFQGYEEKMFFSLRATGCMALADREMKVRKVSNPVI